MRTINELYVILLTELQKYTGNEETSSLRQYPFICKVITNNLDITRKEKGLLLEHFQSQKPNKDQHSEFYKCDEFMGGGMWWYLVGKDYKTGLAIRIKFIKKMIQITKPKPKPIYELYKILLKHYNNVEDNNIGELFICNSINALSITNEEKIILFKHFQSQKPSKTQHIEFTQMLGGVDDTIMFKDKSSVWWCMGIDKKRGREIRRQFIEKMIQITKPHRSLYELYKILLKHLKTYKKKDDWEYICVLIEHKCGFNDEEVELILNHFHSQRPNKDLHPEFMLQRDSITNELMYNGYNGNKTGSWWILIHNIHQGMEIRRQFIKKMIQITKP